MTHCFHTSIIIWWQLNFLASSIRSSGSLIIFIYLVNEDDGAPLWCKSLTVSPIGNDKAILSLPSQF